MEPIFKNDLFKNISSKNREAWQEICNLWQASGESIKRFCEKRGLKKNTFVYWRGKFINEERQAKASAKSNTFLPLNIKPSTMSEIHTTTAFIASIKIQTPQGYVLSLPLEIEIKVLEKLLQLLGMSHA